ncbi:MAG: bifunctional UDP-N-acetylglucosamine diphosphorylase/glucosamine-1-phosphate N-acetyltransferase GlmU [Gammaproteobacteria bacterium]|jgi:bifunctional UDP-N-acetylglucosamine pyrophosphorylase/glucosamine-1-phosphate N-acetyltransferase
MSSRLNIVILAAGQGTRMKSALPKVLHKIAHKPLLEHVLDTARRLAAHTIHVVYGHGGEQVREQLNDQDVNWVLQDRQLGTGHAVEQAMPAIPDNETVLILYGDVPLITTETLQRLIHAADGGALGLLTAQLSDPTGYGRIIRNESGEVIRIVEQKDATDEQRQVKEINTGMLALESNRLKQWLTRLENNNVQGEYYLTDVIGMAAQEGIKINTVQPMALPEIEGINNKLQLAQLERVYQMQQAEKFMQQGVTFRDPARFDLRGDLEVGQDVIIDVNVIVEGKVKLGSGVTIGPNTFIKDSELADNVTVQPNCVIESAVIGKGCDIGPFARVRPDTVLAEQVKIGNFVEVKKATIDTGSKVNHLSYIGDTTMGKNVNIGAGTITCNYDGANKHRTIIGDNVFVGSDTQLVAPVEVGEGATIGAGSTITHDAPKAELTLSRAPQKTRQGWKRPVKK